MDCTCHDGKNDCEEHPIFPRALREEVKDMLERNRKLADKIFGDPET